MLLFFVPHNQHTLTLGAPPSGRLSAKAIPIYTLYLTASARIEAGGENWSTGPRTFDTLVHFDGNFGKAENSRTRVQRPLRPPDSEGTRDGLKIFKGADLGKQIRKSLLIVGAANPSASSSS
jgi:hypothetical protein